MTLLRRRELLALTIAGALSASDRTRIRIGCCAPLRELQPAADVGFDYLEPAAADVAALSASEFTDVKARVLASTIRCEAFNSFVRRKELAVVGPNVQMNAVLEYVDSTLERCKQLGGQVVVWGSSGSRNVPEGFPRERAWDQIAEFLRRAAPLAAKHSIKLAIEPLNKKESNIFNTGAEALRMVNEVNRPEVTLMIDYYHLRVENESLDIFEKAGTKITHLHFAYPTGRLWPAKVDEDPQYPAFFAMLKRVGWSGGLSVEGKGSVEANGRATLDVLRTLTSI